MSPLREGPLAGKVVAITGAASGIGAAIATLLASRGALLSLADASGPGLDRIGASLSTSHAAKVMITELDVRDSAAVDDWIAGTVKAFGRLDGAANCAGVGGSPKQGDDAKAGEKEAGKDRADEDGENPGGGTDDATRSTGVFQPMGDIDDFKWEYVVGINLGGVFKCMRAELKAMEKQQEEERRSTGEKGEKDAAEGDVETCSIVNVASIAGLMGTPQIAAYGASKWGVIGLTKTAAVEYGPKGIRVNCVAPGYIDTPMVRSGNAETAASLDAAARRAPLGRMGRAEEVAKVVAFLLGGESSLVTGACYTIDAGTTAGGP